MNEPEIEQLDEIDALDGAYGDYDAKQHKIRILAPDLLYQLVLEHEKAHARHRKSIGLQDSLNQMIRFRILVSIGILILIASFPLRLLQIGEPVIFVTIGFFLAVPLMIFGSKAWNMLEEAMADREAIAKARSPERPQNQVP